MRAARPRTPLKFVGWCFPCHPRSVGRARRLLREEARDWPVGEETTDVAVLLLSELMANACRHGRTMPEREVRALCTVDGEKLRIEVSDAGRGVPRVRQAGDDDEAGRGLALVAALADLWNVSLRPHGTGKTVWCELRLRQE
ncbi:ATP-binding protein [Streptomyces triculaminicus]|uniref:ATP-binding protein n=1 Tax=Streptomyces triculaminicus TaxID=2816232 RepID=UPI0037D25957